MSLFGRKEKKEILNLKKEIGNKDKEMDNFKKKIQEYTNELDNLRGELNKVESLLYKHRKLVDENKKDFDSILESILSFNRIINIDLIGYKNMLNKHLNDYHNINNKNKEELEKEISNLLSKISSELEKDYKLLPELINDIFKDRKTLDRIYLFSIHKRIEIFDNLISDLNNLSNDNTNLSNLKNTLLKIKINYSEINGSIKAHYSHLINSTLLTKFFRSKEFKDVTSIYKESNTIMKEIIKTKYDNIINIIKQQDKNIYVNKKLSDNFVNSLESYVRDFNQFVTDLTKINFSMISKIEINNINKKIIDLNNDILFLISQLKDLKRLVNHNEEYYIKMINDNMQEHFELLGKFYNNLIKLLNTISVKSKKGFDIVLKDFVEDANYDGVKYFVKKYNIYSNLNDVIILKTLLLNIISKLFEIYKNIKDFENYLILKGEHEKFNIVKDWKNKIITYFPHDKYTKGISITTMYSLDRYNEYSEEVKKSNDVDYLLWCYRFVFFKMKAYGFLESGVNKVYENLKENENVKSCFLDLNKNIKN